MHLEFVFLSKFLVNFKMKTARGYAVACDILERIFIMAIIPATAGTYLVSAEYMTSSGKLVGRFIFRKNAIVGWRLKDSERPEPITLMTDRWALDREPFEQAILLPDGNVETIFGLKTLKDWQNDLIELHLPILNEERLRRAEEEENELLSPSGSEDF